MKRKLERRDFVIGVYEDNKSREPLRMVVEFGIKVGHSAIPYSY
jgi:hypothetical protein